jgi:outer membrane protein TolC
VILSLALVLVSSAEFERNLSPEALAEIKKIESELPEKAITLDFVIGRGLQASDSLQKIKAEWERGSSPYLQSLSAFDPEFRSRLSWTKDNSEPTQPFMPNSVRSTQAEASISSALPTGSRLTAAFSHERTRTGFADSTPPRYHYSVARIEMVQSLWRDAFGRGGRALLASGRAGSAAIQAQSLALLEDWYLGFADLFYDAWLAQQDYESIRAQVLRREKLKRAADQRVRRGSSARTDLLQASAAYDLSLVQQELAEVRLQDIWRALVIALNLNQEFLAIHPSMIPMKLDDPSAASLKLCESVSRDELLMKNSRILASTELRKSAEAQKRWKREDVRADVELFGSLAASNSEGGAWDAMSDSLALNHQAWSVGAQVRLPLFRARGKADYSDAVSAERKAVADEALARTELDIGWRNDCAQLKSQVENLKRLRSALQSQSQREQQLNERYEIGDATVFELVQAGDDATQVERDLDQATAAVRRLAWRVQTHTGLVASTLRKQLGE